MTLFLIVTAILLAFVLVFVAVRGAKPEIRTAEQLLGLIVAVDLPAFQNLTDLAEDEYLRSSLPASDFKRLQRARRRAVLEYINSVSHNAAVLLRLSEAARTSADPLVTAAALQLADSAVQMRLHCILLQFRLRAAILIPAIPLPAPAIVHRYQSFTDSVLRFVSLDNPAFLSRVSAAL